MKVLSIDSGLSGLCAAAVLAGCSGPQSTIGSARAIPAQSNARITEGSLSSHFVENAASFGSPQTNSPIQHLIIIVQQSRSFDNLFAGYPGAVSAEHGETHTGKIVPLKPITLETDGRPGGVTLPEMGQTFMTEYDNGKMNGFDLIHFDRNGKGEPAHLYPYAYVARHEVKPYWDLAKQYALADHMFATERAETFATSEVLIAGSTALHGTYVVGVTNPGGCDALSGTKTILADGSYGPRPCLQWKTMADLLDNKSVPWKYYSLLCSGPYADYGCAWNAYEAIKRVRYGSDWSRNVSIPNKNIFSDLKREAFPAVAWDYSGVRRVRRCCERQ